MSVSLEIYDGSKWLQKTGLGFNIAALLDPEGKPKKRNLHIAREFTLSARKLGVGKHWLTVKIRETGVALATDSIIVEIRK